MLQAADRKLLGCYVRDDRKGHGLQEHISSSSVSGRRVATVDAAGYRYDYALRVSEYGSWEPQPK